MGEKSQAGEHENSRSDQEDTMPKCTIVIRCLNEEQHIGRLLSGIMQQSIQDFEIIIVDSGSTDATLSIASRYPIKILTIRPEEFSFGRSLNIGCQAAQGEYIVVVSAHVYPVYKDWLEQLLALFLDQKVGLVYGKQRGGPNSKYSEHQVFSRWFPEESNPNQNHPFCNNANAAVRRLLWKTLPYDETLTGLEDLDWAKRSMHQGHKIAYSARAEVVHIHDESMIKIYNRYRREAIAMKHSFPQERFSSWDFFRLLTANIVRDGYQASHDRLLLKNIREIVLFRLMQFWGTYRGYQQRGPLSTDLRQRFYYPNGWLRPAAENNEDVETDRRIQYAGRKEEKKSGQEGGS